MAVSLQRMNFPGNFMQKIAEKTFFHTNNFRTLFQTHICFWNCSSSMGSQILTLLNICSAYPFTLNQGKYSKVSCYVITRLLNNFKLIYNSILMFYYKYANLNTVTESINCDMYLLITMSRVSESRSRLPTLQPPTKRK